MKSNIFTRVVFHSMMQTVRIFAMMFILFSSISAFPAAIIIEDCKITKTHGQGYATTITSVHENDDGSHTITLLVSNDGCSSPECKSLSYYSVQALPGTYSDVVVEVVSGSMTFRNIDMGPYLGSEPFTGFRINRINGIGGGIAGEFLITYTLHGGLQTQKTLVKAVTNELILTFLLSEFEALVNCEEENIFPYYAPPEGGKLLNSLIGPELTSLYDAFLDSVALVSDNIFRVEEENVLVRVFALSGQLNNLANILTSSEFGMTDEIVIAELNAVTGWIPISNLLMINTLEIYVNYARPEYPPQSNSGLVTTQGEIAMHSGIARDIFMVTGAGAKVGVLSDSYNKKFGNPANDDILKGDLPGVGFDTDGNPVPNPVNDTDVEVLKDFPYLGSDEGRAMLQIIHDIAPEANLAFRTGFINPVDFANGIIELKDAGCNVIVDDITYITEPFFSDGIVAQAVNSVVAEGVSYFSAAGNFGSKSYENTFIEGDPPVGLSGTAHNFAGTDGYDILQSISLEEGSYLLVLQWDDGSDFGSTTTDLDIYLANTGGNTLFGFNRVNIGGDPIEVLPFTVGEGGAEANLVIVKSEGSENVRFKYIVFRGQLTMNEYTDVGNSTIVGQANAEGAIAVGAVLYSNTPAYGVDPPTIASFSSRGGTLINGVDRLKPEIAAPNGVNTTVELGGFNLEGDLFPNFFGTSAAAPHAAAVAALLFDAKSRFYDATISPEEVREILTTTALDMEVPGYDPASGYGFILADAALITLANPSPLISGLSYDTTLMPGFDSIQITISGNYLTDNSQVYFDGIPVESETIVLGDTAVISIIPPFSGLYPKIQVYNPPSPLTNGTDGGLSDPIYFTTKETLLVTIDDKSKKYGEILPEFTASYSVETFDESLTFEEAGLTADQIARVTAIAFEAINVTPLSNSGLWAITPSSSDPLNPLSGVPATDPLDLILLERFDFHFVNGFLDIERLDLLVKPQDATLVYGEPIEEIEFDYVFNNDPDNPLAITEEIETQILSLLQVGHATALVNGRATALVNTPAEALINRSFMISATALVNSTDLIDVVFENPDLLFDSVALANGLATALVNGQATALVNARAVVSGQATALVNGVATALVNAAKLGQATALVNTNTFNATNNKEAVIMLTDEDIYILAGLLEGEITLISVNLIPDNSAGTWWIIAGTLVTNNFNVTYEPGEITILQAPASVSFLEESLTQTYIGSQITPLVVTDPAGLEVEITYNGLSEAPVNAGSYQVIASITDPNYVGTQTAFMTIDPVQISILADNVEKTYGGTDPQLTYQLTEGELLFDDEFTGGLVREPGEVVGSYAVTQGNLNAGENYFINIFTPGTFTINQAELIITVEDTYIFKNDPLPEFTFTFNGFAFDDNELVLTDLGYTINPDYNGAPGVYTITPQASAVNYFIVTVEGTLYVNPAGPGTKHLIPRLLCVEEIAPYNGFTYIAYFIYINNNSVGIYVPRGDDNQLTSSGIFDDTELPEYFLPGNHSFAIPFDGNDLTWTIASYNMGGQKVTISRTAKSNSPQCRKSGEIEVFDNLSDLENIVTLYPNPTRGKVYLKTAIEGFVKTDVKFYDVLGNQLQVNMNFDSGDVLEVDLSGLRAGVYIIQVMHSGSAEIFRIVKH